MSTFRVRLVLPAVLLAASPGLAVLPGAGTPTYAATTGEADGLVAFGSTRGGSPAIWVMGADGSAPRRVTTGPDYFAAWSPDSTRIAFARSTSAGAEVHVVRADGSGDRVVTAGTHPTWSPDGGSIAYELDGDIWVVRASGAGAQRVTSGPAYDGWPDWSPDGRRIAFTSSRAGGIDIFSLPCSQGYVCNGDQPRRLTTDPRIDIAPSWSPDGTRIAFRGGDDVFVMNRDGSGQSAVTTDPAFDADPAWGPDGATLAFATSRDGNAEIYRVGIDGTGEVNLTRNAATDMHPDWQVPWRAQVGFATVDENAADAGRLPGCAAQGPTTGGAVATKPPLVVSTAKAFVSAATAREPRTILVAGMLDLNGAKVKVASHRTIRGVGGGSGIRNGGLALQDVCDVVVQNLSLGPAGAAKDVLRLTGRTFHVWIDHNAFDSGCADFNDCYDGLFDARQEVDLVTVSWNTFRRHGKVALVLVQGNETKGGATPPGADDLRMTYHHNLFEHVGSRSPQYAFGTLHAFANVWSDVDEAVHCHSGARCLVEHNFFRDVDHPLRTFDAELCQNEKGHPTTCAAGIGQVDLDPALGRHGTEANTNELDGVDLRGEDPKLKPVSCDKTAPTATELNFCDVDPAAFGYAYASYVEPTALESVLSARAGTTLL